MIDLSDVPDTASQELQETLAQDKQYIDSLLSLKETDLPLYSMCCNNVVVDVLIDSGASGSYVAPRLANKLPTREIPGRIVETAGGHTTTISRQAVLSLDAQGYKHQVTAYVLDTKFDVILGRDWLKMAKPMPDWELDTWRIQEGEHNYVLRPRHKHVIPELAYLISRREVQRLERSKRIEDVFVCFMRPTEYEAEPSTDEMAKALVAEFSDVFQDKLPGLPPKRDIEHVIDTGDAAPISRPPYKMSPRELDELRRQLKELLDLGLIRPSNSEWGSPVLFVRKKDGSMRMCIDYRAVNRCTKRNSTPLPRIDECLERLHGMRYFSKIDLRSGYHNLRLREEDIPKSAFNTRYGSFEWLVLSFGLMNSPPVFQSWMNSIVGDEFLDRCAMVYLDDCLIFSRTKEQHAKDVHAILTKFREAKVIANAKKCEFFKTELEFVGHQVTADGILPAKSKVKAIQDWPVPTNVQEVRQFVGLGSHYRRFIRDFAALAAPLTDLTRGTGAKKRAIKWTPDCQTAFEEIKARMTAAPILQPPNPDAPYVIEVDSSDYGVGGVLLQKGDDGLLHPLAFESKKLSSAERSYPAQERELLAILHALRTWRCFVDGRNYQVFSDHHPLKYFRAKAKPTPRLTRWIAELELYDPDIQYKPGKDNHVPDLLSRRDGPACETHEPDMEPEFLYAVKSVQESDWPKFYALPEEQWPAIYKDLLIKHRSKFVVRNECVFRKVKIGKDFQEVRYVMFARRADLVEQFHKSFGHPGNTTMNDLLRKRYWWPDMRSDIQEWLATCQECQLAANADRNTHHAPMKPLDVPPPFSRWHLDFVGELPTTLNGNRWLLVAVDYATNWTIARAVPDATGEAIAEFIYEEIVMRFSCPTEICTDRGANFMSKVLAHYLGRLKVNHVFTSAFHPRTNGKAERTNGILKQMIRKYVQGRIHEWDKFVDAALFACRVRKHRTMGFSPFFLVYGQEPILPGDHMRPFITSAALPQEESVPVHGRVPEVRRLREARALAERRLQANAAKDKERWDAVLKPQKFSLGDHVLMRHENKLSLEFNWKGPYKVIGAHTASDIYQLEDLHGQVYSS